MSIDEAVGIDHMQALGGALSTVHWYLGDLAAHGQLRWPDGRLYNHEQECPIPFTNSLRIDHLNTTWQFDSPTMGTANASEDSMFIERTFSFQPPDAPTPAIISAKIGLPYFPAVTEGMETQFACRIHFSSSLVLHEGLGMDEMQALGSALTIVHLYFKGLSEQGELRWPDGRLYHHQHECPLPLENQLKIAESKKDIHFDSGAVNPSPDMQQGQ